MARATTREAIEATRDNDGIVSFNRDKTHITFTSGVPLEAERLIREAGWLIRPSSAREANVKLFKTN